MATVSASSGEEAYEDFATAIYSTSQDVAGPSITPNMDSSNVFDNRMGNETVTDKGDTTDDDNWQTCIPKTKSKSNQRNKRPRTSTISDYPESNHLERIVTVEGVETNIAKLNPVRMAKFLHEKIGHVQNVERDRLSLKITCKEARQAEQLKTLTEFAGIAVKVSQYDPDKRRKKSSYQSEHRHRRE